MLTNLWNKKMIYLLFFLILFPACQQKEEALPLLEKNEEISNTSIKVDIKGAIKNPGVYELEEGSRVEDAIQKSGGLLETASLTTINLSKRLEDEMVIIVYTNEEIKKALEEETRTLKEEQTCVCPKIENNACVNQPVTNRPKEDTSTSKKVSINSGTQTDFETLPGIGAAKALAIITYRNEHGRFQSIEEIKNVSGIGDATYEKIKSYLTL